MKHNSHKTLNQHYSATYPSNYLPFIITVEGDLLTQFQFIAKKNYDLSFNTFSKDKYNQSEVLDYNAIEIQKYLNTEITSLNHLNIKISGTVFQNKIWNTLRNSDWGSILSYKDLANLSGHPKAYQAVGTAMKQNPLPLIIPCHRVVNTNGVGNYSGFGGVKTKKWLLNLESKR